MVLSVLNLRNRSLPRGIALVLGSLVLAFPLAGFPDDRPSLKLLIPTFAAALGTFDTIRCLRNRWSFYRSEEHTSELQSRPHLVCRLLLEKKKNIDYAVRFLLAHALANMTPGQPA